MHFGMPQFYNNFYLYCGIPQTAWTDDVLYTAFYLLFNDYILQLDDGRSVHWNMCFWIINTAVLDWSLNAGFKLQNTTRWIVSNLQLLTNWRDVTSNKMWIYINGTLRTSNVATRIQFVVLQKHLFFYVLLTVYLSINLAIDQLNAQSLVL